MVHDAPSAAMCRIYCDLLNKILESCPAHAEQLPTDVVESWIEGLITGRLWWGTLDPFGVEVCCLPAAGAVSPERRLQLLRWGLRNCEFDHGFLCGLINLTSWVKELPVEMVRQLIPCIEASDECTFARGYCSNCGVLMQIAEHPQLGDLSVQDQLQLIERAHGHDDEAVTDIVTAVVKAVGKAQHSDDEGLLLLLQAVLNLSELFTDSDCLRDVSVLLRNPVLQQLSSEVVEQLLMGLLDAGNVGACGCLLSELPAAQRLTVDSYMLLLDRACKGYEGESSSPLLDALAKRYALRERYHLSSQQVAERLVGAVSAGDTGIAYQLVKLLPWSLQGLDVPLLQQLAPVVVGLRCRESWVRTGFAGPRRRVPCNVCDLLKGCSQLPSTTVTSTFMAAAAAAAEAVKKAGKAGPSMQQQELRHDLGFRYLHTAMGRQASSGAGGVDGCGV